jgi:acyl-coenzyme A synthetase/AMP-(fatty) acid ligase
MGGSKLDAQRTFRTVRKQPKQVDFVPELPRNAMGKVQQAALRDTYRDLFA